MKRAHLCNCPARVGLGQPLTQRGAVALEPGAGIPNDAQVADDPVPHGAAGPRVAGRIVAQQADEVEVTHNARLQVPQHEQLQVVVVRVQRVLAPQSFLRGRGRGRGGGGGAVVGGAVVVDGDAVDVVHGADEEVGDAVGDQAAHVGAEVWADVLGLEGDEEMDLRRVEGLQATGLDQVGLVARGENGEGGFGVVHLFAGSALSDGDDKGERGESMPPPGRDLVPRSGACAPSGPWSCSRWIWRA